MSIIKNKWEKIQGQKEVFVKINEINSINFLVTKPLFSSTNLDSKICLKFNNLKKN